MPPWGSSSSPSSCSGALVVIRHHENQTDGTSDVETITPAPSSMITSVSHVPASIASAVGVTSPTTPTTPPTATGNASLWQSSATGAGPRPVVFFYGAEFAPYAAAERWPVVVALSRFGTFSALGLMQSSSSVAFSDTPTFTFWQVHYTSIWVDLQAVERYSSLDARPGSPSCRCRRRRPAQAASVAVYDTSAMSFPLLDIANHYVLVGIQLLPVRARRACHSPRSRPTWPFPPAPWPRPSWPRPTRSPRPSAR